jgi:hypothetical protein
MALAAAVVVFAGVSPNSAWADPYKWCVHYAGPDTGGTNCGFVTLEQCRWAASGNGGVCVQNLFYDGRPVTTPGQPRPPIDKKKKKPG